MNLIDFILKAKLSGYATSQNQRRIKFDDGSVGFKFEDSQFNYLDRYYGSNPFAGSEHVHNAHGSLIWLMNYYGKVATPNVFPEKIYIFLKEAMALISHDYPFRGPEQYKKNPFLYKNSQIGTISGFNGIETIYQNNDLVYTLHYHGGSMDGVT